MTLSWPVTITITSWSGLHCTVFKPLSTHPTHWISL
jgi:hypothetical protein